MRRLSEIKWPERLAYCRHCDEYFINDLQFGVTIICPNHGCWATIVDTPAPSEADKQKLAEAIGEVIRTQSHNHGKTIANAHTQHHIPEEKRNLVSPAMIVVDKETQKSLDSYLLNPYSPAFLAAVEETLAVIDAMEAAHEAEAVLAHTQHHVGLTELMYGQSTVSAESNAEVELFCPCGHVVIGNPLTSAAKCGRCGKDMIPTVAAVSPDTADTPVVIPKGDAK